MNTYVIIFYKSVGHDLECERFDWISETLVVDFEDNGYCYSVNVFEDKLEIVVIQSLARHIMILIERYKYKNLDSDMFEYLSSLRFVRIDWWNHGQNNTKLDCKSSNRQTRMQGDRACLCERYNFISIWHGKFGGKFA